VILKVNKELLRKVREGIHQGHFDYNQWLEFDSWKDLYVDELYVNSVDKVPVAQLFHKCGTVCCVAGETLLQSDYQCPKEYIGYAGLMKSIEFVAADLLLELSGSFGSRHQEVTTLINFLFCPHRWHDANNEMYDLNPQTDLVEATRRIDWILNDRNVLHYAIHDDVLEIIEQNKC